MDTAAFCDFQIWLNMFLAIRLGHGDEMRFPEFLELLTRSGSTDRVMCGNIVVCNRRNLAISFA